MKFAFFVLSGGASDRHIDNIGGALFRRHDFIEEFANLNNSERRVKSRFLGGAVACLNLLRELDFLLLVEQGEFPHFAHVDFDRVIAVTRLLRGQVNLILVIGFIRAVGFPGIDRQFISEIHGGLPPFFRGGY